MKYIAVQDAVGLMICHDITEIVPGSYKGPAFRRGHIVREEDVEHLLRLGKEHLYVWEDKQGMVHEDDAAQRIAAAVVGPGVGYGTPLEGRISFFAKNHGLLQINVALLEQLNSIPHVTMATLHSLQGVTQGRTLAGVRVIPLAVPEDTLAAVEACCREEPVISVCPFKEHHVAVITTGSEVYHGRIKDSFGPVLVEKFNEYSIPLLSQTIVPDSIEQTASAIEAALHGGASLVLVTGGMSVDPDDRTPAAIRRVASEVITYGAPIFPGAMFMIAYKGDVPILGLPGCVMYHKASIFDVLLPRLLAGQKVSHADIVRLGHGGLCEGCAECHYPICGFGK